MRHHVYQNGFDSPRRYFLGGEMTPWITVFSALFRKLCPRVWSELCSLKRNRELICKSNFISYSSDYKGLKRRPWNMLPDLQRWRFYSIRPWRCCTTQNSLFKILFSFLISLTCDLFRLVFVLFLLKHKTEAMFVCGCGTNKETSYQLVILLFTEFQLRREWMGCFYDRRKTKKASWWKSSSF